MSYDRDAQRALWRMACYAMGEKDASSGSEGQGHILWLPEIRPKDFKIGQSRRIMNTAFLSMAASSSVQPAPEFPDVPKHIGEVRKQFMLQRATMQDWDAQDRRVYVDSDGTGYGAAQVYMRDGLDGAQMVDIRHIPAWDVWWNRFDREPQNARWVALAHYVDPDGAEAVYGPKILKYVTTNPSEEQGKYALAAETIRLIEYYDLGVGKNDATYMVFPDSPEEEPLVRMENYAGCIPVAFQTHFTPAGFPRPIGRIFAQTPTQEGLNEVESYIRAVMKKPPLDLYNQEILDSDDLKVYTSGKDNASPVAYSGPPDGPPPLTRIPGADVQVSVMNWRDGLLRSSTEESGVTNFMRGNLEDQTRTLGENQLLDQRSKGPEIFSRNQHAKYHRRKFELVAKMAALFDRSPLTVDVFGRNVEINGDDPRSFIANFLDEPSRIVVGEDALEAKDMRAEHALRTQMLSNLIPLLQAGLVDPGKYVEEMLKAMGEEPAEWRPQAPDQAQDPMAALMGGMVPQEQPQIGA